MVDLLLINPPTLSRLKGFPYGLALIGEFLYRNNFNINILDAHIDNISHSRIEKIIKNKYKKTNIFGIYTVTPNYRSSIKIAEIIKKNYPNSFVIMGGPHATNTSEIILKYHPEVDVIVRGEGEFTLLELMNKINKNISLNKILGITYRNNNKIIVNHDRPLIKNLDILPYSFEHVIDRNKYSAEIFKGREKSTIFLTSRGCPYKCVYCSASANSGYRIRYFSINYVMEALNHFSDKGFKRIYFEDDTFTINKKRVTKLCKRIINSNLNFSWHCETRVDCVDKELLRLMHKAGCNDIFYGVESMVQKVLDNAKKGFKVDNIKKAIKLTNEAGIRTFVSVQVGLPGETKKTVDTTIKRLKQLNPDEIALCINTVYPGTQQFKIEGFPLDIYENYKESTKLTKFLGKTTGHGINGIHPYFLDKNELKKCKIVHNIGLIREVYKKYKKEFGEKLFKLD